MSEWGNPAGEDLAIRTPIHNVRKGTRGTETSKYPEEEKETSIPRVAASEMGRAQTGARAPRGYGPQKAIYQASGTALGKPAEQGESPVRESRGKAGGIQSTTRHVEPCGKSGGPPPKAKYYSVTDRAQYREGKVKRTPGGE